MATLYCYEGSTRAAKILVAAKLSSFDLNVSSGANVEDPAFLKLFPAGKIPALSTKEGSHLFETNAILRFVASDELLGTSKLNSAFVDQWISFSDSEIEPASCNWVWPCLGLMQYNKQSTDRAKTDIQHALKLLQCHLETRTFLVGDRLSLADVAVAVSLYQLYTWVLEPSFREPFYNVTRWFNTVVNQPAVSSVLGDTKLCEKMAQFDAKKFAELSGKGAGAGDKKGKKEKKEQKPKEAKPNKEKTPEPAAMEEDDEPPAPKPSKDPFVALPGGNWNMDEWKRTYSNNDTMKVAMPYFYEKFEPEFYSIWYCTYKYSEDLKMTFMSGNLVGGMFQRLDRLRKHGFGTMLVFGEDNNNTISGVWFWRGQGLAFELNEDLQVDYESYDWKKLDFNSEADRKMINEYWSFEGDFANMAPLKYDDGRVYK